MSLWCLYDTITSQALEVKSETYGSLLCPVLLARLPPELQLIISFEVDEKKWDLVLILEVIEVEIVAREMVTVAWANPRKGDERGPLPTATTLVPETSKPKTVMPAAIVIKPIFQLNAMLHAQLGSVSKERLSITSFAHKQQRQSCVMLLR